MVENEPSGPYADWLSDQIENTVASFERARTEHLQYRAQAFGAPEVVQLLDAWGKALLKSADELSVDDTSLRAIETVAQKILQNPSHEGNWGFFILAAEVFEIRLGKHAVDLLRQGHERTWMLLYLSLVLNIAKSPRAAKFLQRVSRCYIFGFDPECVMICRSVLDAEFNARISNDDCIDVLGPRPPRCSFTLADRIEVAAAQGRLSDQTRAIAERIRQQGNHAVHAQPDVCRNALKTICETLLVIRELGEANMP